MSNNTNDMLLNGFKPLIESIVSTEFENRGLSKDSIKNRLEELLSDIKIPSTIIEISTNGSEPVNVGTTHNQFETILKVVGAGLNTLLVGQAGTSKTHTVSQVAKALGLEFYSQSVSMQTTKTDLLGFVDANGVYRYGGFVKSFRDGGVFNLDEIDAGN